MITFLVILSLLIIRPYISTLLFSAAIAYVLYPLQTKLKKRINKPRLSAFLITSGIFILMVLLIIYGVNFLITRFSNLYDIVASNDALLQIGKAGLDNQVFSGILSRVSEYIFSMTAKIPHYAISIFIFLISFYYFLLHGPEIYKYFRNILPIPSAKKEELFRDVKKQVNAILYVQLLIGIAQGILGGIGLFLFGYEFPVVGGIIMGVLGFIPVIGPPLFYIPLGLFSIAQGAYAQGIGLILFGVFVISTIDNVLRPFMVGKKAQVHPLLVLIGLFGGVLIFGVAGILVGPIILSVTITLVKDLEKFHIIE